MLRVDATGSTRLKQEILRRLKEIPQIMKTIADSAAANERAQHEYRNRTGNLERSTRAKIESWSLKDTRVVLEMAQPYAIYIRRMGLTQIDALAAIARAQMQKRFEDMRNV